MTEIITKNGLSLALNKIESEGSLHYQQQIIPELDQLNFGINTKSQIKSYKPQNEPTNNNARYSNKDLLDTKSQNEEQDRLYLSQYNSLKRNGTVEVLDSRPQPINLDSLTSIQDVALSRDLNTGGLYNQTLREKVKNSIEETNKGNHRDIRTYF